MKKITLYTTLVFVLAACQKKESTPTTQATAENLITLTQAQYLNAGLQTTSAEYRNMTSTLRVNGIIDVPPQNMVSVSMPLGGYLKSTRLLPGMHIVKGEVIATLEDQQYINLQQDYLATRAKLVYAQKEYERQRDLNKSQASSDKVFQMAEAEYQNLRIALSALTEKLKLISINPSKLSEGNISKSINIYAPISGFVSKVNVNIGKYVNPTDVLFELVNPDDIHLNLKIFEKDVMRLSVGQKLFAFTNSQPDQKHPCEIILISKDLSTEDHTVEVHCHFNDYDKTLLPGMYMNAEIELKNNKALALPEEAVVNFEGKDYLVMVQDQLHYILQPVTISIQSEGFVSIAQPELIENKKIVTKGAYTLLMQLKNKAEEE
ncbi:efflux RND transporter periplasmic adaptor subunit [Flavobacterium sp. CYK-55]|uniref:efflux RND transporter periplasmic adaptor subunit n=1 Tax=Flavobacterium sp. CYK-55 TaxID=2835529 RepID=UPI001BCAEF7A|nr:efflux RND transporter periplasmic adaptor subunit [Flavobacterium sp. CYK-55]MBS7788010.1 efflux RND transporter periplasmic adaptor subunit [Flavobacterium sp. CYK-55]